MNLSESIMPNQVLGSNPTYGSDGMITGYIPTMTTYGYGMTKLDHFMLEIVKGVLASGRAKNTPKEIIDYSQTLFEELKKRIEDIEAKGLLSDQKL